MHAWGHNTYLRLCKATVEYTKAIQDLYDFGGTAVHYASSERHAEVAELLMRA
jgi:hypothetical protein